MELFEMNAVILILIIGLAKSHIQIPEQIHLSLGTSRDIMVVMWANSENLPGFVQYGLNPHHLEHTVNATTAEMPKTSRRAVRYVYRAEMKGLVDDAMYFYEVNVYSPSTEELRRSERYHFRTFDDEKPNHKYLVLGDFGSDSKYPTYNAILKEVTSENYTAIWHNGDFAYDLFDKQGKIGDDFMRQIQPFASQIPYMTSVGNHEIQDDPFIHYRIRFSMPDTSWPMPANKLWYSYNIGLVHFVVYSTEVFFTDNYEIECQQFNWLKKDLISANQKRDRRPWVVAMGHRPMYCSVIDIDCYPEIAPAVRNGLEDLFYAQGVDLIIESHEHYYRRLWPVYKETVFAGDYVQPRAPIHIITGAAGNSEGGDHKQGNWDNAWSAFWAERKADHSYGILTAHNSTHMQFQQKSAETNAVIDDIYIIQSTHGPFLDDVHCSGSYVHPSCDCPSHTAVLSKIKTIVTDSLYTLSCWVILVSFVIFFKCVKKRTSLQKYSNIRYEPVSVSVEDR